MLKQPRARASSLAHPLRQSCVLHRFAPFFSKPYKRTATTTQLFASQPPPHFWQHRLHVWQLEEQRQKTSPPLESKPITVHVVHENQQKQVGAHSFQTTPFEIANKVLPRSLCKEFVICRVSSLNDESLSSLWDLERTLPFDCKIEFFTFDSPEGREVFWHSSAHLLGYAMEELYGDRMHLCDGPALMSKHGSNSSSSTISGGYFYEGYLGDVKSLAMGSPDNMSICEADFGLLEKKMQEYAKEKILFERMVVPQQVAVRLFEYNPFKLDILDKIHKLESNATISLYKCGNFIDLCRGPHVRSSAQLKATKLHKVSGAYWKTENISHVNLNNALLQRVYGITFPEATQLKAWQTRIDEAAKRDHRILGKQQQLFMFHEWSPGSPFFFPQGAHIFNKFVTYLRAEYRRRGYEEVISPQLYNKHLWETSGHWEHYKDDMFTIGCPAHSGVDSHNGGGAAAAEDTFGLKPMNCPGHCLMFGSKTRSYRELPIRWADFSPIHRNELAGALSGLTRVRRFHQDDSHIFCTHSQVPQEIKQVLQFVKDVYALFGFKRVLLRFSTRPKHYMGSLEIWDQAEQALQMCLNESGMQWELNEGDGAFYGPKIDIAIEDSLERMHQCATVQLDFQLPHRFNLKYQGEDSKYHTPVIIHRAILGSLERFIALLAEHTAGKWPFWISPRQCMICPVSEKYKDYAHEIANQIKHSPSKLGQGFTVDVDDTDNTLNKKIREAQLLQYNFIVVVGQEEASNRTVNVRRREGEVLGMMPVQQLIRDFQQLEESFQ